jgi:hypothetical protein
VTKRLKDLTKSANKSDSRNVAVPVKKDDVFKVGEEYYFVLVRNAGKSSSSSVVGDLRRVTKE